MFGNENGRGVNTVISEGSSASGLSTMELLQVQMKEDSDEHLDDRWAAVLDPALAALSQVRPQAASHASTSAREIPTHRAATIPPGTVPGNGNSTAQATPPPSTPVYFRGESPLSEPEDCNTAPLTPLTNRRGKLSAKAKGKRPAIADDTVDTEGSGTSRVKRAKRSSRK